jgi:hypothetical protein
MSLTLQTEVCPKLGVDGGLICLLLAHGHLQEYLQHGDKNMLQYMQKYLTSTKLDSRQSWTTQQALVRAAIHDTLYDRARNMFELIPHENAPLVLDAVLLTSREGEDGQELFLTSVDAELARCWRAADDKAHSNTILGDTACSVSASLEPQGRRQVRGDCLPSYFANIKVLCLVTPFVVMSSSPVVVQLCGNNEENLDSCINMA